MQWQDEAIIISLRRFGESSAVLDLLTKNHGRHLGLVRGAYSKTMRGVLQIGNQVAVTWRGRLAEHLGNYTVEAKKLYSPSWIQKNYSLFALQTFAAHLRLLPVRENYQSIYETFHNILANLGNDLEVGEQLVRFEILFLQQLGFGLDLRDCAATGTTNNLIYVSPRSARAVSKQAGKQYENKLLPLPDFLLQENKTAITAKDICAGLQLTAFFLNKHVYNENEKNILPVERNSFYKLLEAKLLESK